MTDLLRRAVALTITFSVVFTAGILRAADSAAIRAETLYKQGLFAEAVAMAEKEYSQTGNPAIKTSLIKYLTELGLDLSFKENYSAAAYAFNRALALAPDDNTLKDLAETSEDLSSYAKPPQPEKKVKPPPKTQKTPVNSTYLKQQRTLILKLEKLAQAIENQPGRSGELSKNTIEKLDKLMTAGDHAAASINKAADRTEANLKKTFVATAVGALAAGAALIVSAFLIVRYAFNRYHTAGFLAKPAGAAIETQKKARRIPLLDSGKDTRYEGIDIIEAELSSEDSTEASVAKKLLEPFLNDTDIELKIRALQALHKYSAIEASKLLEREAVKGIEGSQIFCRLIQLLPPQKSVSIAEKLMKKTGPRETSLIANALLKINTPDLSPKLRDKINSLAGISADTDWIVS
ncbi:MAG: hypothetical protein U9O97_06790 [Elusimicrobiota bacterium]|nr:hypothetical protein [Elusimicrobiota bacterium]